ncbi:hypothetical protein C9374_011266 [Naegleria lovaniensis]|uniref:Uncharacterized protein n=1 Tax=Naegleria lovaniensis TaxID=51637 RepID=A0AA88KQK0_NAELO|nr:uncharacterized protein C9374_011266 [Naegleria lovaniensis]KAG2392541.1 hypothetical protein C9374_011266 [Naegleria lovaniensis]
MSEFGRHHSLPRTNHETTQLLSQPLDESLKSTEHLLRGNANNFNHGHYHSFSQKDQECFASLNSTAYYQEDDDGMDEHQDDTNELSEELLIGDASNNRHHSHEFNEFNDSVIERISPYVQTQASSSPITMTPFSAEHVEKSNNKRRSKKQPKNEQKAKLDFHFLKRFFIIIGYCLRVIERNSDYHVLDENGKRIVRKRWWFFKGTTKIVHSESENGKQTIAKFWNNLSIFNWLLVMLFLVVCVGEILLGNEVGKIPGAFYKVIIDASSTKFSDSGPFVKVMLISLLWICGITLVKTFRQFVLDCVRLFWRRNLTFHLQRRYFEYRNYYNMIVLDKRVDNPDQRITKDAENFIDMTCKFVESLFTGPITVFYYTVTVYLNLGWQGPLCCYAFFIIGSILNKLIISPIANLWFIQEKYEGNFRYTHTQIRSNAESIAFYGGDANERIILNQKLKGTINNRRKIVMWNILLNGHMNLFGYIGSILAYMIIALSVFVIGNFVDNNESAGNIADKISVSSFQVMMLISGFTTFIQTGSDLSELAGFTARLGEMKEVMDELEKNPDYKTHSKLSLSHSTNFEECDSTGSVSHIEFKNVSVFVPKTLEKYYTGTCLVENLCFRIEQNQHTIITGPSGSGKSSILRILANLWPHKIGQVIKPTSSSDLFYVPQNPYICTGTLRDQITYPLKTEKGNTQDNPILFDAICKTKLQYILDRVERDWDVECDWNALLSPGEKQRLALARLFYHKPKFIIMDESTSACDVNVEELIYDSLVKQGSTLISVGHRPTLIQFHTHMLEIDGSGSWNFSEIIRK